MSTTWTSQNKSLTVVPFQFLIDSTYFLLIDSTYIFLIGDSTTGNVTWTSENKS